MGTDEEFDRVAWEEELHSHRTEKDRIFAETDQSPIPEDERSAFDGLEYYDPDPQYRVTATVTTHEDAETRTFNVMHGEAREYRHVATVSFELQDASLDLGAYRELGTDGADQDGQYRYFAPFKDETSGEETYSGGRYLEVYAEDPLSDGQEITIDFNVVYTPFCAFNDSFACPLPPVDNWLDVPIEAGEKDYQPPEDDDS
jgi:uncharacterized protein (DUF1684 family)